MRKIGGVPLFPSGSIKWEGPRLSDDVEIEISGREANLILRYGYPFPDQAPAFEAVAGKAGFHRLMIERFWLEMLVGDLSRSIKEVGSPALQEELDSLCVTLETAMRYSD